MEGEEKKNPEKSKHISAISVRAFIAWLVTVALVFLFSALNCPK